MRLAAAPATAGLLAAGHFNAALGLFAFAGLSDAADGFLAKRFNFGSKLGRILDPAADKALMLVLFVTLAALGNVPIWLTATVIARDVAILGGLAVAVVWRAPIRVQPLMIGKLCTANMLAPGDAYGVAAIAWLSGFAYLAALIKAMRSRSRAASPA
jgi:cardiolipin synthase